MHYPVIILLYIILMSDDVLLSGNIANFIIRYKFQLKIADITVFKFMACSA